MRMSVLLLLVTIVAILIPSEAQAKRYRIEQTGSHSWTVTDDAELLDDPTASPLALTHNCCAHGAPIPRKCASRPQDGRWLPERGWGL